MRNGFLLFGKGMLLVILFFAMTKISVDIISIMDTRHAEKGDILHPYFRVVIFDASDESFALVSLSEAAECSNNGNCYLIPTKRYGKIETGEINYSAYDLLEKTETRAVIQTTSNDEDNTFWYTYTIDNNNIITPIKTKMLYFGYMFPAIGIAVVLTLLFSRFGFALLANLPSLKERIRNRWKWNCGKD
jgi:hypothetical protein